MFFDGVMDMVSRHFMTKCRAREYSTGLGQSVPLYKVVPGIHGTSIRELQLASALSLLFLDILLLPAKRRSSICFARNRMRSQ